MSDQNQLTTISDEVKSLITSGATTGEIHTHLQALWNAGGDEAAITAVWKNVEALALHTEGAITLAQTAVVVANEMSEQRDLIADELSESVKKYDALETAVVRYDHGDHPLVDKLIENIQEQAYADFMETGYSEGIHEDEPQETIYENGHFGYDESIASDAADMLFVILGYGDELPDEMYAELGAFITDFTGRVEVWKKAKSAEQRRVWEAELKNRQAQAAS